MSATTAPVTLRSAILTGVATALAGVLLCLAAVVLAGASPDLDALRVATRAWLVAHGSGITVDGVAITVLPLGGMLAAVALVAVPTAVATRRDVPEPGVLLAGTAGAYGVVAALAAALAGTGGDDVSIGLVRGTFAAFVVAAIGAWAGISVHPRHRVRWWPTENAAVRAVVRAATAGLASLLLAAAVLYVVLLAVHLPRAADLWAGLAPTGTGAVGLAAVSVAAVPNLVLWTLSAMVGPGFALGTETSVDLTGVHLGAVPALPTLAALPSPGELPGWTVLLGLVPLLAGAWAGWRLEVPDGLGLPERVGLGAAAGALAGASAGVLVAISGGGAGAQRLAEVGPPTWTPLLVAVPVLALGGALGQALTHYRGVRAGHDAPEDRPSRRPRLRVRDEPAGPARRDR
ncbi:DUF6350 family protein [Aeromicrobium sp. IC_218]|uniref:cell division protein PerM n=1 Tax=Aeromicrobium sp. IC_218 TaxID=2545468 RepID=UPI00103C097C|nr:DUF6350 family protein [Aeromicrobium sp. IC_218]TCI97800.1 hypothetical protein E0W78_10820 [Aeromicrobium sp. IC_218]